MIEAKPTYDELLARVQRLEQQQSAQELALATANEAHRVGADRLQQLADHIPIFISYVDKNLRYRSANRTYEDFFRKSRQELIGAHVREVLGNAYFETQRGNIEAALAGHRVSFETPYLRDGVKILLSVQYVPDMDCRGITHGLYVLVRDITAGKQAEEALLDSQTTLTAIIESTQDLIWAVNSEDFGLLTYNHAFNEYFLKERGITLRLGLRPEELFPGSEFVDRWHKYYRRALASGQYTTEYEVFTGTKSLRLSFNLMTRNGCVFGISVFGRDVTEQKRTEKALLASETRYRGLFEGAVEGIYQTTLEGNSLSANPALAKMLGYTLTDGKIAELVNLGRQLWTDPAERSHFIEQLLSQGIIRNHECQFFCKGGQKIWVSLNSLAVRDSDGQVTHLQGFIEDITERKRTSDLVAARLRLQDFATDHSIHDLLVKTLEEARGLSESARGSYSFVQADQETLWLQACLPEALEPCFAPQRIEMGPTLEPRSGWARCIQQRCPVIQNERAQPSHAEERLADFVPRLRELLVPLVRNDKVVALLEVGDKATDYTETDVRTVTYLAEVAWELTERKQAEEALRKSEERHRTILQTALDGFLMTDTEGHLIEVNETYCRMSGYTRKELLELRLSDLEETESSTAPLEHIKSLVSQPAARFESRHRRKDGTLFDVEISVQYRPVEGGQLVAFLRDITEQKRATENIALLKHSVDVHYDAAYWTDSDEKFIYVNKSGSRALGYEPQELLGKSLHDVNPKATDDRMKLVWERLRRDGFFKAESVHRRRDGSEFPVEIITSYVQFGGKEYTCGFARDISDRKRAEEETARLTSQLQQAQKMESVGRLAGGVAHDFNNMLGVILGHTELAMDMVLPQAPIFTELQEIRKAARRSTELTQQLLAFARKQTVAPRVLDLNDTVAGMLKMVKRLVGEDLQITWQPAAGLWPLRVDPAQIDQILANLCVNARDAIANVGKITISTGDRTVEDADCTRCGASVPGDYVWLAVSDDGCGMDPATLPHVFEPFFTTKALGKGTGLGLATVYGILQQNQGFVDLKSAPGQGTTITVYLPRYTGPGVRELDDRVTATRHQNGQETILLVEDESSILCVARRMLESRGYTVLPAATPGEALRLATKYTGAIHLLITDVVLPEMNGRDLANRVVAIHPHTKQLFMSGYTADVIAHQGVLDEGVSFIQKPFSTDSLTAKVRQVLDGGTVHPPSRELYP